MIPENILDELAEHVGLLRSACDSCILGVGSDDVELTRLARMHAKGEAMMIRAAAEAALAMLEGENFVELLAYAQATRSSAKR